MKFFYREMERLPGLGVFWSEWRECSAAMFDVYQNSIDFETKVEHQTMTSTELLRWIVDNLLNESQLNVVPPGEAIALRYMKLE